MKAFAGSAGGKFRSRWIPTVHRMGNLGRILEMGLHMGPRSTLERMGRYPWLRTLLRINQLHGTMTRGRTGLYREANSFLISNVVSSLVEMIEAVFDRPGTTVLHEDLVPPEILFGMGLDPWMAELLGIVMPMVNPCAMEPYIDVAEGAGIPGDVCSLPKSTVGLVLERQMPQPAVMVTSNMPCDGGMGQYTVIERALKVPTFRLDVPFDFYGERAVEYFSGELNRLVAWLEEHTPGRMDWDRLKAICEERNRAMELELDLWDLLRVRPAPMAAEPVYLTHLMYAIAQPGTPRGTRVFREIARLARCNREAGQGALTDEKHRVALWNPPTMIFVDLFAWAEQAHGVALLMDMLTYHRHPYVDTTSPKTMIRDLARIIMQGPMARHTRGPADNFFGDLFHLVEAFDLDMIWMAGHIGCKNTQALSGMFREKCRNRGIPLLIIDYDLSDTRVETPAGIRGQVNMFMETLQDGS